MKGLNFKLIGILTSIMLLLGHSFKAQQTAPIHLKGNDQDAFIALAVPAPNMSAYNISNPNRVFIFANTALSTSQSADDFATNGSFQILADPFPKLQFGLAYNPIGISPTSVANDSISINNIQFPDAGSAGFMSSISWRPFVFKNASTAFDFFRLSPSFEFSLRNIKYDYQSEETIIVNDTTTQYNEILLTNQKFSVLNYNLGIRLEYFHINRTDASKSMHICFMPYLNLLNIPNEDANSFYLSIGKENQETKNSQLLSFGTKISFGYKNLTFFSDLRQNYSKRLDLTGTELEGFVFNIGTSIAFKISEF
jgi:hypothetical protein